jgi:hypothetical protein
MGKSDQRNELYNKAMTNTSKMQVAAILSAYDFKKFSHIVDVGGGLGFFLSSILEKNRSAQGTLFDLPQVLADPEKLPDKNSIEGRLTSVAGSFFETIPAGGDLYTLKNILHGWNDEDSIKILNNIRNVIREDGRLMIIEVLVDGINKPSWGKASDIFMMAGLGGRERTREEFQSILQQSGFTIEQIMKTVSPLCLIVATPSPLGESLPRDSGGWDGGLIK